MFAADKGNTVVFVRPSALDKVVSLSVDLFLIIFHCMAWRWGLRAGLGAYT